MIDLGLSGKRALVAGAGRGIGRASALLLASAGARIGCLDADAERGETVADEVRARGVAALPLIADVARRDQVEDGGEVPCRGPADEGQRVVVPVALVRRVVTPRTVRAGDAEGELLLVEIAPPKPEPDSDGPPTPVRSWVPVICRWYSR